MAKKLKLAWRTEQRKVSELVPYERNPRTLSPKQEADLKKSLEKFNLVEVPAINADNMVIAGHARLKILHLLNRSDEIIDVRVPNRSLSKAEFKEYLLRSNVNHGSWLPEMLAEDYDIGELLEFGFDDLELGNMFDDLREVEDDEMDIEHEIEAARTTDIKCGDKFRLGPHLLLCANSQDLETVRRLVGDAKIDLVNVDVPYNIGLNYSAGLGGKKNYGGSINDKKTNAEYRSFLRNIIGNSIAVSKPDAHYFFWADEKYIGLLQELYKELDIELKRVCLWLKQNQNPTPAIAFNKVVEFCLYGVRGAPYLSDKLKNLNEVMNREVGTGVRLVDDVLDLFSVWLARRLPTQLYEHPTMKPPSVYEKSLRRCSKPGQAVLDLCAGSGSLMVACEGLKRRAFLCEIEPIFCQVIINRYEKISNKKATRIN